MSSTTIEDAAWDALSRGDLDEAHRLALQLGAAGKSLRLRVEQKQRELARLSELERRVATLPETSADHWVARALLELERQPMSPELMELLGRPAETRETAAHTHQRAHAYLEHALALEADSPAAWSVLATLTDPATDPDRAHEVATRAARLAPSAHAWVMVARAARDRDERIQAVKAALALDRQSERVADYLEQAAATEEIPAAVALSWLKEMADDGAPALVLRHAAALRATGAVADALAVIERAADESPRDEDILDLRVELLYDLGREDEAAALEEELLGSD